MDPLKGVLDEKFFLEASPNCLAALARLVDDALAKRFQSYLEQAGDSEAAKVIQQHLGDAIKASTFHLQLIERGSVKVVDKIDLSTVGRMRFNQQEVIEELTFLRDNMKYIRSYIQPRKKSDYEAFVASLPAGYKSRVVANRVMFFQPHARARATGVGNIIRKREEWMVALKGLQFRDYFARAGFMLEGYQIKEF